jgi:putative transposase
MPYDPSRHHRRSIRLPGYDYGRPGAYFVTIVTQHRVPVMGQIVDGVMVLSPIGRIVEACWKRLPTHFARVTLDAFVVMPDHLHALLILEQMETAAPVQTDGKIRGTRPESLAAIIQNFKAVSTRRVNQDRGTAGARFWQRNYYERIVAHTNAFQRVRRYIIENPRRAARLSDGSNG